MPSRRLVLPLCGALVATVLPASAVSAAEPDAVTIPSDAPGAARTTPDVARGLIVQTESGVSTTTLRKATAAASGDLADVAGSARLTSEVTTVGFDEPVPYDDAAEIAAEVEQRPDVVSAVPDARRRTSVASPVTPDDSKFSKQYGVWDPDYASPAGGYSVKAPKLWRSTTGSSSVVVAVVDTGIRGNHPDLKNQLVAGYDMIGADQGENGGPLPSGDPYLYYTSNDGDGRDSDPSDPGDWIEANDEYCYGPDGNDFESSSWHGTHVAGIVAAEADNGRGISGIAPGVKVQPVRALGKCGGWDSDIMAAITWASGGSVAGVPANATPADVINLSLGGYVGNVSQLKAACRAYTPVLKAAFDRGSTIVAAAGNELANANRSIPAACGYTFSVGATGKAGFRAFYSNSGSTVDISAPGGDTIFDKGGQSILSTVDAGGRGPAESTYARYQGTSMATPAVAAGAALLYSLGLKTPTAVQNALRASVSPFRYSSSKSAVTLSNGTDEVTVNLNCTTKRCGKGILDLSKVPAPIGTPTVSGDLVIGEAVKASSSWTRSVPLTYQWYRDGSAISGATASSYTVQRADVGHRLSFIVRPGASAYAGIRKTSTWSAAVPDGPTVTVTGLPSSLKYGTSAKATVAVAFEGAPVTGKVRLVRGTSEKLAEATLSAAGTATFSISGTRWSAGSNRLRVAYLGTSSPKASSAAKAVTVYRAVPTSTRLTMGSTVNHTGNGTMWARVYVPGVTHPRGTFGVYDGSRRIQTATIAANANGIKKITLPRLAKGKHTLRVKFLGTSVVAPKTSARKTVTSR